MPFTAALAGLQASTQDLKVTGNNISNASTTGFKESRAEFSDIYASTGALAVGQGVTLSKVRQTFSQGTITVTQNPLDMAINGDGFFITKNGAESLYTRAGMFGMDKNGYIVNSANDRLQGFSVNDTGNIVSTLGDIKINTENIAPKETSNVGMTFNLDARKSTPSSTWVGSPTSSDPTPATDTYDDSTSMSIYDSLGNSHVLTAYFIKDGTQNQWDTRFQIDGADAYTNAAKDNTVDTTSNFTAAAGYSALSAGDLTLNGSSVGATATDGISIASACPSSSALAIKNAINLVSATSGVTAAVNQTTVNLGTYTPGAISAGQFQINGVNITPLATTQAAMLAAINGATYNPAGTTVTAAADSNGNIILSGRAVGSVGAGTNIEVNTTGMATGNFSNFTMNDGKNRDYVGRGTITLTATSPIVVAGNAPTNAGIAANTYLAPWKVSFNTDGSYNSTSSDPITLNYQAPGATAQTIALDFSKVTQFGTDFGVSSISQNGYTTGRLNDLSMESDGTIYGRYSNGQSAALGEVMLASFKNTEGLTPKGDSSWAESVNSGSAVVGKPGTSALGMLQGSALESSNVDLTNELVHLIIAQRDFSANSETIKAADHITQTILNLR